MPPKRKVRGHVQVQCVESLASEQRSSLNISNSNAVHAFSVKKVNASSYSYQQGFVSIFHKVHDVSSEKVQGLLKVCRICHVEDEAEGCDKLDEASTEVQEQTSIPSNLKTLQCL